jgi:ABC-type multidrug transport system fused ATPase/permease subunit
MLVKDEDLWTCLEKVQLKDPIKQMDLGLETVVGSGKSVLSAGQKQLLCIGRAILKNSKILLIDEATSNVDNEYVNSFFF